MIERNQELGPNVIFGTQNNLTKISFDMPVVGSLRRVDDTFNNAEGLAFKAIDTDQLASLTILPFKEAMDTPLSQLARVEFGRQDCTGRHHARLGQIAFMPRRGGHGGRTRNNSKKPLND